jgi:hypothetical protein
MEFRNNVGRRGSHFFGSQMAVRLSDLCAGRALSTRKISVLISVRGWVKPRAIVRLEGLSEVKNTVSLLGIEPASFWFVA